MKLQVPEALDGLKIAELETLLASAREEIAPLIAKDDADLTDEEYGDIVALDSAIDAITAAHATAKAAAQERTDKLAAARGRAAKAQAEAEKPQAEAEAEAEGEAEEDADQAEEVVSDLSEADIDIPDDASELIAEEENLAVTASAAPKGTKRSTVRTVASSAVAEVDEQLPVISPTVIIAAANLPTIESGAAFSSLSQAAEVWQQRTSKSPANTASNDISDIRQVMALSKDHSRQGFAKIKKSPSEFSIDSNMSIEDQLAVIESAANERTRFGSKGLAESARTAGGGWCAPSPTVYDFCSYETVSGILDVPTLNILHGGLNYTKGPDYASLAATWGFLQTEAQAEAGTAKACYSVECPDFEDHRLDAIGFCVTAGVLTNSRAGFPELVRRVLEIGTVAHAHKVNAEVISRISTNIGAAVDYAEVGSNVADVLDAAVIQALRIRYSLAMDPNATIEAVFPVWALESIRSDVARRLNIDNPLAVTAQMIVNWFSVRNIAVQFVYDYQPFNSGALGTAGGSGTWTSLPTEVEFMMYPAGAYVKGTSDVIDLDTIYDSVGLSTNTYTAAFFEEGLMVFNRCGFGVKVNVSGLNRQGAAGYPAIGAGSGVTFAPVTP